MIEIRDSVGEAEKGDGARLVAVGSHKCACIKNQARAEAIGERPKHDQRRRRRCVRSAESGEFARPSQISANRVRVGKRCELVAVEPAARPGNKLQTFVGVKVVLAEILADEELNGMAEAARAEAVRCAG